MSSDQRGAGFVQLGTPTSIHYTTGQTLSLSDLARYCSRVECVALPGGAAMAAWRQAVKQYSKAEGFQPLAADAEAERMGEGPILPALAPVGAAAATAQPFFHTRQSATVAASSSSPSSGDSNSSIHNGGGSSSAATANGINIVSLHKVSGRSEFIYPDYDGVLSGGVVPEVIATAEEQAELEAARAFYTSPLMMSPAELDAFEELQALWKSRARSHSALGAQHRHQAGGSTVAAPGGEEKGEDGGQPWKRGRTEAEVAADAALDADDMRVGEATEDMLAEALRMADDLLQLN